MNLQTLSQGKDQMFRRQFYNANLENLGQKRFKKAVRDLLSPGVLKSYLPDDEIQ
jgi:hypothetical protein